MDAQHGEADGRYAVLLLRAPDSTIPLPVRLRRLLKRFGGRDGLVKRLVADSGFRALDVRWGDDSCRLLEGVLASAQAAARSSRTPVPAHSSAAAPPRAAARPIPGA